MEFVKKTLAILFSSWLFVVTLQAPCNTHIKPRKALKRLRRNYMFVEKPNSEQPGVDSLDRGLLIKRRTRRDTAGSNKQVGGKYCPWSWESEDSLSSGITQIPRYVVKAVCPECKHFCKQVSYTIKVLVKKDCDKRTGEETFKWVEKKVPVAFVFRPS